MIDTHAHLADPVFDADRAAVLERARQAGITGIVLVGETLADARRNLELAAGDALLHPAAGLYPAHLDLAQAEAMVGFIREHRTELVAIGEVGLDHWLAKEARDRQLQEVILARFIDLSLELDLPLNVHSRSAGRAAVELLLQRGARRVQMHAFDAKPGAAAAAVEAGFFFSIPPSVVHSRQKRRLVQALPLERLLLETDSPVLGPRPGERNEPANAAGVLAVIAELKGLDQATVRAALARNTRRLYGGKLADVGDSGVPD
ncbi:MAG: TatD family hydrolase [Magnetococcales bacterium]|nr:TatD family hydrolase [Magnetococcales bacterium]